MKPSRALPLLACAALGVAWWLGRSERHTSPNATTPVEAQAVERSDDAALVAPSGMPSVAIESVVTATSADSTRTPSADVAPPAATFALRGTVRDERDAPVEGCEVVAFPRRSEERPSSEPETRPSHRVPAPGGSFVIAALEPGLWFVHAERGEQRTDYAFVALDGTAESAGLVELRLVSRVRLAGVVLDPDGRPLASGRAVANSVAGGGERLQNCDDDGRFEFPALAAGPVLVHARADDWAPSEEQHLDLAPGAERTDLVLRLRRGARITGVVVGDGGESLADQEVVLSGVSIASATTDERGRFAFEGLAPGDYVVTSADGARASGQGNWILRIGNAVDPASTTEAHVALTLAEGEVRDIELGGSAAERAPEIVVHGVVRLGGKPCPNASVGVAWLDVGLRNEVLTDAEGRFSLSIAAPDSPDPVTFSVTLLEGPTTYHRREIPPAGEVQLLFELPDTEIAGRVIGPEGQEARGAPLSLRPNAPGGVSAFARADESGRFLLRGIQPGSYMLRAGNYGSAAETWAPVERTLTIGAGEHLELELTLLAAARLRGTVRTADGRIFPGATVLVFAADRLVSNATCDSQGDYALGSLVPERVRLLARTEESCSVWRDVELRAGEIATLDLELAPAVRLEIEIVDERGEPVAAHVWIEDDAGHKLHPSQIGGAHVDEASRASVSLPPGDYQVVAWRSHAPGEARRPLHLVGPGPERVRLVLAWTPPGR